MHNRSWHMYLGVAAIAALIVVPLLYASGLLERDQRRLERVRETHAQEVDRALEIYTTRIQRANETLDRVYGQLINRYEQRGETELAAELQRELEQLKERALNRVNASNGENGDADPVPPTGSGGHEELIEALGPSLVDARGRTLPSRELQEANYVLLYFSAQWCGPCRTFTPRLIDFHNEYSQRGRVAVILVSSDRSEQQMAQYMRESDMPWHAVPYGHVGDSGLRQKFGRGAIPHVVVLDRRGEVILSSHTQRPLQVLRSLADRL